jgi:hypothetical protein
VGPPKPLHDPDLHRHPPLPDQLLPAESPHPPLPQLGFTGGVAKVFNFGNKKISEPTEKWEIPEIPEISAQIQIEFNFFKKN